MNSSQTLEDIARSMDDLGWLVYFENAIATNGDHPHVWIGLDAEKIVRDNSDEGDAILFTGTVNAHVTLGYAASIDETRRLSWSQHHPGCHHADLRHGRFDLLMRRSWPNCRPWRSLPQETVFSKHQ